LLFETSHPFPDEPFFNRRATPWTDVSFKVRLESVVEVIAPAIEARKRPLGVEVDRVEHDPEARRVILVTWMPSAAKMVEYSKPITPAPTIASDRGRV